MKWIDNITASRNLAFYLFVVAFFLYLFNSWGVSIYILDEAKNSSCAREMLESGNWLVPTYNYDLRTDKPPLHYFFMMLSYSVFGVNPFSARLFSAVFGALTILVTFLYTKRFTNIKTAFWTAVVLLASIHLSLQFHLAVPDPYLIFFMTWSIFAFFAATRDGSKYDWLWMYLSMGLATLTKGPVAILLPGLIFLLYLIFSKNLNWKMIVRLKPHFGVLIVIAVVLPWYLMNGLATDWEWTRGFFFDHNLERFSGEREGHGGSFLITLGFVLIGLFPFAVLLPQALRNAFRNRKENFVLYNLVAGLTIVGFFMVSQTKLPNYTVPAYPFLALIIAVFISDKLTDYKQIRIAFIILLSIAILLPIGGFIGMKFDPSLVSIPSYSIWLAVLPLTLVFAWFQRKKLQNLLVLTGLSGTISALVFFGIIYPKIDAQNPVTKSIDLLENKEVASFEKFNAAYAFELKKEIPKIPTHKVEEFLDESPNRVIITTEDRLKRLNLGPEYKVIFSCKDLFELPTTVIINRPEK